MLGPLFFAVEVAREHHNGLLGAARTPVCTVMDTDQCWHISAGGPASTESTVGAPDVSPVLQLGVGPLGPT